jgi:Xaa-Pro aminopeptidase
VMDSDTSVRTHATELADELTRRHSRIVDDLLQASASCLVAIRDQSITYLTGYTSMTWKTYSRPVVAVLTSERRLTVLVAETEADSARNAIPGAEVQTYIHLRPTETRQGLPDGKMQFALAASEVLGGVIANAGPGTVLIDGLNAAWPPIGQLTQLVPGLAGSAADGSALLWRHRLRKSDWEIARLREASSVLERAYDRLRAELRPGMSEREIARRFIIAQWEAGAHDIGPLAVVADPSLGLFGSPTDRIWHADDLLYIDGCALVDGYWSDYCRTFAARPVTTKERDGYARARRGLACALRSDHVATAADLGQSMADTMGVVPTEVGFGRFGHGIGLHAPEPPSLHPEDQTPLAPGFTLCIEPTVRHEGINFVIEEEHLLTEAGFVRLSPPAPEQILTI